MGANVKCYIAGVDEWVVGYVFAASRGKARAIALRKGREMVDVEYFDVVVRRAKPLDLISRAFGIAVGETGFIDAVCDNQTDRLLRKVGLAKYDKQERYHTYSGTA